MDSTSSLFYFIIFKRFYLFIHERHREKGAETQAEGEAGSKQGAGCGTGSLIPGSHPEPKTDAQLLSHSGNPSSKFFGGILYLCIFMKQIQQWHHQS